MSYFIFFFFFCEKHDYFLHWDTQWEKKTYMCWQTRRPLPQIQAAFKHAGLCMRSWSVYGRAVRWHRCPAVHHSHQTHTRCTQLFQCTLSFNYDHTEGEKTHGHKKRINKNKQATKQTNKNIIHLRLLFIWSLRYLKRYFSIISIILFRASLVIHRPEFSPSFVTL